MCYMINKNSFYKIGRLQKFYRASNKLFGKLYDMMENKKYNQLINFFRFKINFTNYNEKIDQSIYECLKPMLEKYGINEETVTGFLNDYYIDKINKRQGKILYQQPMIIMLYLLARDHAAELQEKWCFTQDILGMVFSDLGISSDDNY